MQKRQNFWIILILILAGYYFWPRTPPDSPTPVKERRKPSTSQQPIKTNAEKPPAVPPPPTTSKPIALVIPSSPPIKPVKGSSSDPHKPPPHAVPFELINGYVVAYGDIVLGKPTRPDFPTTGFIEEPKIHYWEREIPFSIHSSISNPEPILRVIAYLNASTPFHFVPYNGQDDSLVFTRLDGHCLSYLGKISGHQPIYLDDRCGEREITHEIVHAIGLIHEHSRMDRDRYVKVNWSNIEEANQDQFDVTPESLNEVQKNRPFDYHSVMLYAPNAFAKDRSQPTLISLTEQAIEPVTNGLSEEDLNRIRILADSL